MRSVDQHIAFRVDASARIGTGHLMRCLTLADALKERGANTRFVSRQMPDHLGRMLRDRGHALVLLDGMTVKTDSADLAHFAWLGTSQRADAADTVHALSDRAWDWLVVDHYALDARWESLLRSKAKRILAIDDLADRVHDCDALLDQNLHENLETRYTGKVPAQCRLFLGPRYALLREEFGRLREEVRPRTGAVHRVLIFFGGVDADNRTADAIAAVADSGLEQLSVDVVIGAEHPYCDEIKRDCTVRGYACHVQTSRMAELMAAADLSIGAGGSASWERCCLGLPTLTLCLAENQRSLVQAGALGGIMYVPAMRPDVREAITQHLRALLDNPLLLRAISAKSMQAVDGRGVLRLAREMGYSAVGIRVAKEGDAAKLYAWRNHPAIRAVSRDTRPIEEADHIAWFRATLADPARLLLIGEHRDQEIGVVRFDVRQGQAEVSIYLVPGLAGAGLGGELLLAAENWLVEELPSVCVVEAQVLGDNTASHNLFASSGYELFEARYRKNIGSA